MSRSSAHAQSFVVVEEVKEFARKVEERRENKSSDSTLKNLIQNFSIDAFIAAHEYQFLIIVVAGCFILLRACFKILVERRRTVLINLAINVQKQ